MMRHFAMLGLLALAGCATTGTTAKQDEPQVVEVPVAVGCVAGERPAVVAPLNEAYPADKWDTLTARQKAALVTAQALRRQSYGEALNAATSACR